MFLIYVTLNENEALAKAITLIMYRTKKGRRIINFQEIQKFKKQSWACCKKIMHGNIYEECGVIKKS